MSQIIPFSAAVLTDENINTLAEAGVIPANTPKPILAVFAETCRQHGLSPFKKEIYLVKYGSQYNTIVAIDGLRAKAARTGLLAGRDDAKFDLMPDGSFKTAAQLKGLKQAPTTATVTVYKIAGGIRCPFTKTVVFSEYCPVAQTGKWATMPFNMIEKCAEAAALRAAFSDETAGLSIEEELPAIQEITISASPNKPDTDAPMDEATESAYHEWGNAIEGAGDFKTFDRVAQQWAETPFASNRFFAEMVFKGAAKYAQSVEDLTAFYNAHQGWCKKDPQLLKQLSMRKAEIEAKKLESK